MNMCNTHFEISLGQSWRRFLLLATVLAGGVLLAFETLRVALAQTWGESADTEIVQRAISVDPSNPNLYNWLGALQLFEGDDPAIAVRSLRKAIELNPNRANYWVALGRGCFAVGDQACSDQAFEQATRLAPSKPDIAREAGAYYIATGRPTFSLAHFRKLLQISPDQAPQVLQLLGRSSVDSRLIWESIISRIPSSAVACAYLDFLVSEKRFDEAEGYWKRITASRSVLFRNATPYLERLINAQRYAQAVGVWNDLQRLHAMPQSQDQENLIFNASFEQPILNAGFDWRLGRQEYLDIDLSGLATNGRGHSMQVEFTAPHNSDVYIAEQFVPITPNQTYRLSASVRSEGITSDSGPRLKVQDPKCPACLDVMTETTVGTTQLHQISVNFAASPELSVVRLSLWRPRGRSFPMDIQGRFWLESISLQPSSAAISDTK